jgi:ankyrin repeat protein
MENLSKILPIILIVVLMFVIREYLSRYRYRKYCRLHEAARTGDLKTVRRLLDEGYATNFLDTSFGLTPLHYAIRNNHLEIAKLLIEHGARLADPSIQGITPLEWSLEYLSGERHEALLNFADRFQSTGDTKADEPNR